MKIGITVDIRHSIFSAGHPNSCIAIAEILVLGGHEVVFLRNEPGKTWWDDCKTLEDRIAPSVHVDMIHGLDVVIEVGYFLTPLQRKKFPVCVWYCRKPALFTDLEATVYNCRTDGRDLEGISEVWVSDVFNGTDDSIYLETLYPSLHIKSVPWVWTPTILEAYRKENEIPLWLEVNKDIHDTSWSLHICETNMSNLSSCTIPLVTVKQLGNSGISKISIHNTHCIEKSKFFKENVLTNCSLEDTKITLLGRQRLVDWCREPGSIILSHTRFIQLRQANLEAAWLGIPVIHNNSILRDLGCGLEKTYYEDNSILEASDRVKSLVKNTYLTREELIERKERIFERFGPDTHVDKWLNVVSRIHSIDTTLPVEHIEVYSPEHKVFTVVFTDMWADFNVEHNTFILALEAALESMEVRGYSMETLPHGTKHDIHIFGPFGSEWKKVEGPKVHFTGENTGPINDPSILLNIGFQTRVDPSYLRMPLWMFELDWFGADLQKLQNPLVLPIETCSECPYLERKREKFCAFIVSNPKNPVRNEAFHAVNKYKKVDSAGRLFNTVGDKLFAGLGGGGGELMKHEFLKDYRFCLAYENELGDGYVTEKLLHAKAAGCIPIYWGSSSAITDFNPRSFINASECSIDEMVSMVRTMEEDSVKWKEMASIPLFYPETVDTVRSTFSQLAQKILPTYSVPKLLGRAVSNVSKLPYFVTGATYTFLPSVHRWLKYLESHKKAGHSNLLARVYIGSDISDEHIETLRKEFSFATFQRYPQETPEGFPDFWEPGHYAWKVWILKTLATDPSLQGKLVFYMDSGSILITMPEEWIQRVIKYKLSFLEDSAHQNERWCHEDFCKILNVSEEEKKGNQIIAGLVLFIAGDTLVKRFFSEAYKIACIRKCISGEKWAQLPNGEIRGHRHDQSVLSILSQRYKIHRYPLEKVYCDVSARTTYYNGLHVYVHRGNFKSHIPLVEGIDETYVINLDRRPDRRTAFLEAHPDLKGKLRRHCAYDGLSLHLTPKLSGLFKPNDFFWKKAVMGCALSHLKLWTMLLREPREIETYLILEDDVRFLPGWKEAWQRVYPNIPEDWECIYLGGVLPPNRAGFKSVMEPVVDCPGLSRIALNTLFGHEKPTRHFHFCAYSYVLSRKGAKRLLEVIELKGGIWTSADHILFNSLDKENVYVLDPLVAGASQDDDAAYINSNFNDFSRKDTFDSDLWNNDERFSLQMVTHCLESSKGLDITGALNEIPIGNQISPPTFLSLDESQISDETLYEGTWLRELIPGFTVRQISSDTSLDGIKNPVIVVRRPKWKEQLEWINTLKTTCKIIHLTDELSYDPVGFYSLPQVMKVIRFYPRLDDPKVLTIPLGYHWQAKGQSKPIGERSILWSFHGTDWADRSKDLEALNTLTPNSHRFYEEWGSPDQLSEEDYISLLLNTQFVPCPRGYNIETYRFYEALECGCIPVFIEIPPILESSGLPFLKTRTWEEVSLLIQDFRNNPSKLNLYHETIVNGWKEYKGKLQESIRRMLV